MYVSIPNRAGGFTSINGSEGHHNGLTLGLPWREFVRPETIYFTLSKMPAFLSVDIDNIAVCSDNWTVNYYSGQQLVTQPMYNDDNVIIMIVWQLMTHKAQCTSHSVHHVYYVILRVLLLCFLPPSQSNTNPFLWLTFQPGIEYQESKNGTSTTINVSYFFGVNGKGGGPSLEAFFLPCVT